MIFRLRYLILQHLFVGTLFFSVPFALREYTDDQQRLGQALSFQKYIYADQVILSVPILLILVKEMFTIVQDPFELDNFFQNNLKFDISIIVFLVFLIYIHKMAVFVNMSIAHKSMIFIEMFIIGGIIDICCGCMIQALFNL